MSYIIMHTAHIQCLMKEEIVYAVMPGSAGCHCSRPCICRCAGLSLGQGLLAVLDKSLSKPKNSLSSWLKACRHDHGCHRYALSTQCTRFQSLHTLHSCYGPSAGMCQPSFIRQSFMISMTCVVTPVPSQCPQQLAQS